MAWDASRPVPWRRLIKEGSIFLALGVIAFALFVKNAQVGSYVGLVIGLGIYVGVSAVMAKFGYTRQSMKDARVAQMERNRQRKDERGSSRGSTRAGRNRPSSASNSQRPAGRPKPAPTRRTTTGPSQRPNRKRR